MCVLTTNFLDADDDLELYYIGHIQQKTTSIKNFKKKKGKKDQSAGLLKKFDGAVHVLSFLHQQHFPNFPNLNGKRQSFEPNYYAR